MSAEAVGFVYRHSPYTGATFAVHLAIADTVSDQFDNQFWMSTKNLADKTRTTRRTVQKAIDQLCEDRYIYRTREATQHYPATYQFLFPAVDIVYETRPGAQSVPPEAQSETARGVTSTPKPNTTQKPKHSRSPQEEEFDEWWNLYPKKVNKENAIKAWKAHSKKTKPGHIIAATRKQLATPDSILTNEYQYIPYPASWLNSGSYNNEPVEIEATPRPYDQPARPECPACDSSGWTSFEDDQGRYFATQCTECSDTI